MAPKLYVMPASPPCRAVMMLAKEIELEVEIEEVDRNQLKTPEMLELNPEHTVPILVDDDFVLWESHAIMPYLVGKYSDKESLYPKDDLQKTAIINQRMHFESGVLFQRSTTAIAPLFQGIGDISDDDRDKIIEAFGYIENYLEKTPYVAGEEMTVADLSILSTVASIELVIPVEEDRFPNLSSWLKSGKELTYFEECNSKGLAELKDLIDAASA
ncbi:glutathione S-transferase 1-like [Coccinella septempunctata]|uniref:glutathione S-transferase 1-like n=1 Tax=Coccinella septempunctata TaxID=41139 RepID=UPI001D07256F|nr:glutathione S-transferase 1-like [Coccinella septempunctata]